MRRMNALRIGIVMIWGVLSFGVATQSLRAGGEVGNGIITPYRNAVAGFKLEYPANWAKFELGQGTSFTPNLQSTVRGASSAPAEGDEASLPSISILTQQKESIQSLDDLEAYLRTVFPEQSYEEVSVAGFTSLKFSTDTEGQIYIFRNSGLLTVIRYDLGITQASREQITKIIESIQFFSLGS